MLIGSGVSTPAVPTGEELLRETIARVFAATEERAPDGRVDLLGWWRERYGEPTYSAILEAAFKTAEARRNYLASFFAHAQPTEAHREIARLAKERLVRVFVTTNFDKLLERALEKVDITPTVIFLQGQLTAAPPRESCDAYILKIHGDYRDGPIRNTPEELARLDPDLAAEFSEITRRYSLIVLGYSGGDAGVMAILNAAPLRTGMYWIVQGSRRVPPDVEARAIPVPVENASAFVANLLRQIDAFHEQSVASPALPDLSPIVREVIGTPRPSRERELPQLTPAVVSPAEHAAVEARLRPTPAPGRVIGRETQLELARRYVRTRRFPMAVYGEPGVGKTVFLQRLLAADESVFRAYKGNVAWLDISGNEDSLDRVAHLLAVYAGAPSILAEQDPGRRIALASLALSRTYERFLLVLDGVDADTHRDLIHDLLGQLSDVDTIVGTTGPLAEPHGSLVHLEHLLPSDALELFEEAAGGLRQGGEELCGLLQNQPFAVSLIGSTLRMSGLSVDLLADDLRRSQDKRRISELPPPLDLALELAFDYATGHERELLRLLGAFAESGASVWLLSQATSLAGDVCEKWLERLVQRGLVRRTHGAYSLHRRAHAFARSLMNARARSTGEEELHAVTRCLLRLARERRFDFAQLQLQRENLLQGADWAVAIEDWPAVHEFWMLLQDWLASTGDWSTAQIVCGAAVRADDRPGRERELASVLVDRADISYVLGQTAEGVEDATRALWLARTSGDDQTLISALCTRATLYPDDDERGLELLFEAWSHCEKQLDWPETALVAYKIGESLARRRPTEAETWVRRVVDITSSATDTKHDEPLDEVRRERITYRAYAMRVLGELLSTRDRNEARAMLQESLRLREWVGTRYDRAMVLRSLADIELDEETDTGRASALTLLQEAIEIFEADGVKRSLSNVLLQRAGVAESSGDFTSSVADYRRALQVWSGDADERVALIGTIVNQQVLLGEASQARVFITDQIEQAGSMPSRDVAVLWMQRANVELSDRRPEDAAASIANAVRLVERNPVEPEISALLHITAAGIALARRDYTGASHHLEAVGGAPTDPDLAFYVKWLGAIARMGQRGAEEARPSGETVESELAATLRSWISAHPDDPMAHAYESALGGNFSEALRRLDEIREQMPSLPLVKAAFGNAYFGFARMAEGAAQFGAAAEAYSRAVECTSDPFLLAVISRDLGDVARKQNYMSLAADWYRRASVLFRDQSKPAELARVLLQLAQAEATRPQRRREAQQAAEEAVTLLVAGADEELLVEARELLTFIGSPRDATETGLDPIV